MMSETKTCICIGGPLDGQRYAILYGAGFMVPNLTLAPGLESEDYQPNKKTESAFHHYKTETFHTPQGDVSFWVPKEQTPLETLTLLLTVYQKARGRQSMSMGPR